MLPECDGAEEHGSLPEKISCIGGRIKEPLKFAATSTLLGRRAMVNKLWCQGARKWLQKKEELPHARLFSEPNFLPHVSTWYLLYRWLIFVAWASIVVCSIFEFGSYQPLIAYDKWPIYLTNWDLVLGLCQALLGGIVVLKRWRLQRIAGFDPSTLKLGTLERVYWFLYVVTTTIAVGVTVSYWGSVYDPKKHFLDPLNIMLHVCNSILMIVDLCVTNVPFRLRNFWWCLTVVFLYIIFSLIYFAAGGLDKHGYHYIYKILDWKRPLPTLLICAGEILFVTALHAIMCLLSRLRDRFSEKFVSGRAAKSLDVQSERNPAQKSADIV